MPIRLRHYGPGKTAPITIGKVISTQVNNIVVSSTNTGSGAHPNVQPTIVTNHSLRVL
jgi:hypothetical protein